MNTARMIIIVVVVLIGALPCVSTAQTEGHPWPMFRHDLQHTGRTPYTGPAEPTVHWTFTVEDGIASSPAIADDGTVYVGAGWYFWEPTDSSLYAINPDGTLKWRYLADAAVFSSPAIGPDGVVYFGCLDMNLYAVTDAATHGELQWRTHLGMWVYSSPAVAADGTIYAGSLIHDFFAVNPDGSIKWSYPTGGCVFSSPAISPTGDIYFGSKDHHIYSLADAQDEAVLRWDYATGEFYDGHLVDSSPALGADGTLYVGTDPYGAIGQEPVPVDTEFYAVNDDGSLKWAFAMDDGVESSPAIGPDGTIYVGSHDGHLYAIRDEGDVGVQQWRFPTGGWIDGSPAVDGAGTIYFGSRDSTVYALNPDGSVRWSFLAGAEIESSPAIDGNGTLYIGTFDGTLYALGTPGPDVGVVNVEVPAEVGVNTILEPAAVVRNYRAAMSSFAVTCIIDTVGVQVYESSVQIEDLGGAESHSVTFAPWLVGPDVDVVYNITVATLLAGDNNESNDQVAGQAVAVTSGVPVPDEIGDLPARSYLDRCYPNPFNPRTTIAFNIATPQRAVVGVYDMTGQRIRRLADGVYPAGYHSVVWFGRDDAGREAASGTYLVRLETADCHESQKVVLVR